MNKTRLTCVYLLLDFVAALITWVALYMYRKHIGEAASLDAIFAAMRVDSKFWLGLALYPVYWVFIHAFFGYYNKIYRKSRLDELVTTIGVTLFGCLIFFFIFILDDIVTSPNDYVKSTNASTTDKSVSTRSLWGTMRWRSRRTRRC